MRLVVIVLIVAFAAGCSGGARTTSPVTDNVVVGKCRFCGKPGYSTGSWLSTVDAQESADNGDEKVLNTIVCGACRKSMEAPK